LDKKILLLLKVEVFEFEEKDFDAPGEVSSVDFFHLKLKYQKQKFFDFLQFDQLLFLWKKLNTEEEEAIHLNLHGQFTHQG
jgi:hypothetical protein